MRARAKLEPARQQRSTLSAEDRAFLDFVARLAVEQALREASAAPSVGTCGAERTEEKSNDNDNA